MSDIQAAVLSIVERWCSTDSGLTTADIAIYIGRQPGHESNRQHLALVGRELRALENEGLVRRLDDQKPVVWCKVDGDRPSGKKGAK